jgi:hypothetical protein
MAGQKVNDRGGLPPLFPLACCLLLLFPHTTCFDSRIHSRAPARSNTASHPIPIQLCQASKGGMSNPADLACVPPFSLPNTPKPLLQQNKNPSNTAMAHTKTCLPFLESWVLSGGVNPKPHPAELVGGPAHNTRTGAFALQSACVQGSQYGRPASERLLVDVQAIVDWDWGPCSMVFAGSEFAEQCTDTHTSTERCSRALQVWFNSASRWPSRPVQSPWGLALRPGIDFPDGTVLVVLWNRPRGGARAGERRGNAEHP